MHYVFMGFYSQALRTLLRVGGWTLDEWDRCTCNQYILGNVVVFLHVT